MTYLSNIYKWAMAHPELCSIVVFLLLSALKAWLLKAPATTVRYQIGVQLAAILPVDWHKAKDALAKGKTSEKLR